LAYTFDSVTGNPPLTVTGKVKRLRLPALGHAQPVPLKERRQEELGGHIGHVGAHAIVLAGTERHERELGPRQHTMNTELGRSAVGSIPGESLW
jgi:hypothetical protein